MLKLSTRPKAFLFDLGGVLVDIDFANAFREWAQYSPLSTEQLASRFAFDESYKRHERGELPGEDCFAHLKRVLELDGASESDIERGWNSIFVGEIAETRRLVERARRYASCFVFSNTNASHMATWRDLYPSVVGAFDRIFTSHELGMRKPEQAAFAKIVELTQIPANEIVFFDDLAENVDSAIQAGLHGVVVRSPADVRRAFEMMGLREGDEV
ncbi:MAG: HAD-IA family hydrolase [Burkholderiaceae bacterium]